MNREETIAALIELVDAAHERREALVFQPPGDLGDSWVVGIGLTVGTSENLADAIVACRDALGIG